MARTVRITLDIKVRPLTADELEDACIDELDEECRPTGTDDDLDDATPYDLGEIVAESFHDEAVREMFAGSNLYMYFAAATVVEADWVEA